MPKKSATDKLIRNPGVKNSDSSEYQISFYNASGTFSAGADFTLNSDQPLLVIHARSQTPNITEKVRAFLRRRRNKVQVQQATKLLDAIEKYLQGIQDLDLPEIKISASQDKAFILQWRVGSAYFGAAIRPNTSESSWFLIQGDAEKGYRADGYLDELDYETQLPSALDLLIKTQIKHKE